MQPTMILFALTHLMISVYARNSSSSALVVSLPYEYTYLLPDGFTSVIPPGDNIGFVNSTFVGSTTTSNQTINDDLARAAKAPFISYSDEFSLLLGSNPNITLIEDRPGDNFAFEGAVWVPNRRQVWFTSALYDAYETEGYISILHLDNGTVTRPNVTVGYKNFQRAVYSQQDDLVYFSSYRDNATYKGGLLTIHPDTYEIRTLVNGYFGLTFNALNELLWAPNPNNSSERFLFVNDIASFLAFAYDPIPANQVWTSLYRWDFQNNLLLPVLTGSDIPTLGSGKASPDLRHLYLGALGDPTSDVPSSQIIYRYDLNEDMWPVNPRVFAVSRFFMDAIQIDDAGRVWSAEGDGFVVRSQSGRILGVINKLFFGREINFGNIVLTGDTLVLLAVDRLWTVKLTQTIVSDTSRHVFG